MPSLHTATRRGILLVQLSIPPLGRHRFAATFAWPTLIGSWTPRPRVSVRFMISPSSRPRKPTRSVIRPWWLRRSGAPHMIGRHLDIPQGILFDPANRPAHPFRQRVLGKDGSYRTFW